jgi:hypothetical protein
MNTSLTPTTTFRWNPALRSKGLDNETRLQAGRVIDSVEQMKDAFLALDNSAQDLDSQEQRVWLRDAAFGSGAKVTGSLNDETGLIAYLGADSGGTPQMQLEKKELGGTTTWARRSSETIEQIFQFPNGEMEYNLARW